MLARSGIECMSRFFSLSRSTRFALLFRHRTSSRYQSEGKFIGAKVPGKRIQISWWLILLRIIQVVEVTEFMFDTADDAAVISKFISGLSWLIDRNSWPIWIRFMRIARKWLREYFIRVLSQFFPHSNRKVFPDSKSIFTPLFRFDPSTIQFSGRQMRNIFEAICGTIELG